MTKSYHTRFAPSPTGLLHLGHAYAAWVAVYCARESGGKAYVRIEDIDGARSREVYASALCDELKWLGLDFEEEIMVQSTRLETYGEALDRLHALGVLYPCFCTRREIREEWERIADAPQEGRDGILSPLPVYSGKCRDLSPELVTERMGRGDAYTWRLDCRRAEDLVGMLEWTDLKRGTQSCVPSSLGDVILGRKDAPASYHIAVTVDDAAQGITLVTRGEDLFPVTGIHRTLQALLGLNVPEWYHHPLVRDAEGMRLAKRDQARSLAELRAQGYEPKDVLALLSPYIEMSLRDLAHV